MSENGNGQESEEKLLPENACCKSCEYSELVAQIDPATGAPGLEKQRVCRRLPPSPILMPMQTPAGPAMTIIASHTPVQDVEWCYEYAERLEAEVQPTGLVVVPPANDTD